MYYTKTNYFRIVLYFIFMYTKKLGRTIIFQAIFWPPCYSHANYRPRKKFDWASLASPALHCNSTRSVVSCCTTMLLYRYLTAPSHPTRTNLHTIDDWRSNNLKKVVQRQNKSSVKLYKEVIITTTISYMIDIIGRLT